MATEIEHKFLLLNDNWRQQVSRQESFRQGYLNQEKQCSVRVRTSNDRAWLNIKSATIGTSRDEYEYSIPLEDANRMLNTLAHQPLIEKIRYYVNCGKHTWEIDEFAGDNAGLIVAEIELSEQGEAFDKPDWIGEEVTQDIRYYNTSLSRHPYKDW